MKESTENTAKNDTHENSSTHYIPGGETESMIKEQPPHCSICDTFDNLKAFKGKHICSPCIKLFQDL